MIKPLEWTPEMASREFSCSATTIIRRLNALGEKPGERGKYTTRQIAAAIYNDIDAAKLRNAQLEGDLLELELREKNGKLVAVADVSRVWRGYMTSVRQIIKYHPALPEDLKESLLVELRDAPIVKLDEPAEDESEK